MLWIFFLMRKTSDMTKEKTEHYSISSPKIWTHSCAKAAHFGPTAFIGGSEELLKTERLCLFVPE